MSEAKELIERINKFFAGDKAGAWQLLSDITNKFAYQKISVSDCYNLASLKVDYKQLCKVAIEKDENPERIAMGLIHDFGFFADKSPHLKDKQLMLVQRLLDASIDAIHELIKERKMNASGVTVMFVMRYALTEESIEKVLDILRISSRYALQKRPEEDYYSYTFRYAQVVRGLYNYGRSLEKSNPKLSRKIKNSLRSAPDVYEKLVLSCVDKEKIERAYILVSEFSQGSSEDNPLFDKANELKQMIEPKIDPKKVAALKKSGNVDYMWESYFSKTLQGKIKHIAPEFTAPK